MLRTICGVEQTVASDFFQGVQTPILTKRISLTSNLLGKNFFTNTNTSSLQQCPYSDCHTQKTYKYFKLQNIQTQIKQLKGSFSEVILVSIVIIIQVVVNLVNVAIALFKSLNVHLFLSQRRLEIPKNCMLVNLLFPLIVLVNVISILSQNMTLKDENLRERKIYVKSNLSKFRLYWGTRR